MAKTNTKTAKLVPVFCSISFAVGADVAKAIETAKSMVAGAGDFDAIDPSDDYVAGNLEVPVAFWKSIKCEGGFEATRDGVTLEITLV